MLGICRCSPAYICGMHMDCYSLQIKCPFVFTCCLVVLSFGFTGCEFSTASYEVTEHHKNGTPDLTMARMDVSGMMCAHACGGKIKKELLKVDGVANVTIAFEEDRELNYAEVEYDERVVEVDGLVETIAGIADGKLYAVEAVEVIHFAKGAAIN